MSRVRVYIKPFNAGGTAYLDWVDVSDDISLESLSTIRRETDSQDFDTGFFANSSLTLSFRNDDGRYGDVGETGSMFGYKRSDSLVKVTWDAGDERYTAGMHSYDFLGYEKTVFFGVLNDDATSMDLKDRFIKFDVLGLESLFERFEVTGFVSGPTVEVNDLLTHCFGIINAAFPTPIINVVPTNLLNTDAAYDAADINGKSMKTVINETYTKSGYIFYFDGDTPYTIPRNRLATDPTVNFYGPTSTLGNENIIDIREIRNGLNRFYNWLKFNGSVFYDSASIAKWGRRTKEITISLTGTGSGSTPATYGDPQREFILVTPLTYAALSIERNQIFSIDYPAIPGVSTFVVKPFSLPLGPNVEGYQMLWSEIDLVKNTIAFALQRRY